jgi:hypothetical protein
MSQTRRRTLTGNRTRIFLGGKLVGWATNISINETMDQIPVARLSDIQTQFHETTAYSVSGNIGYTHILEEPFAAATGDRRYLWLAPNWANRDEANRFAITFPEQDLTFVDVVTGKVVFAVRGFKPSARRVAVGVGGITMVDVDFVALSMTEQPEGPIFTPQF